MDKNVVFRYLGVFLLTGFFGFGAIGQIDNSGCVMANWGTDAGLYSGQIEFGDGSPAAGTMDWFTGSTGIGIIDQSQTAFLTSLIMATGNPTYYAHIKYPHSMIVGGRMFIDGLFARDNFGGTGYIDTTSYNTASKNGEDPAIWDPGIQNVLGKNDLIDVAGFMYRNGTTLESNLYFSGLIHRAEPGGDAYMDFEFFVNEVTYTQSGGFSSGGPQLGHTAFTFDGSGNITKVGDFIFNVSLTGGGTTPDVEVRLWVSYADYIAGLHPPGFTWGPNYDGAFTGSPYGYASIIPTSPEICGIVNSDGQTPLAPPWGARTTKANSYQTTYDAFSVVELQLNMTHFGIDHVSLLGIDSCYFPIQTFVVKTRASNSFTAQLKDFAGPFAWGQPKINARIIGDSLLSCANPTLQLVADPIRNDVTYLWSTVDGNILTDPANDTITIDQAGTYTLIETLINGCELTPVVKQVYFDPLKPMFQTPTTSVTVSCNGNDGTINLTVNGGTPPYSYAWSNGSTTEDLSGLAPGGYTVTITDASGCQVVSSETTVYGKTPAVLTPVITNPSCFSSLNGSISLSVSGNGPFSYHWSNNETTASIGNLGAGTYSVTVTDADGCTHTMGYTLTQPTSLNLSISKTNDTDVSLIVNNGTADLTVSGGTPDYTFLWSNAATTEDLSGLSRGIYRVTVTDSKGCISSALVQIWEPEICDDGTDNDGDGLTDCNDTECQPSSPGSITPGLNPVCVGDAGITYTVSSTPGYTYNWTVPAGATITAGSGSNQITVTWTSSVAGKICVKAVTPAGCISLLQSCYTVTLNDVPSQPGAIQKAP